MKIIVDEMPKEPRECIFSEHYSTGYICGLHQGRRCEISKCDKLKPITDCYVEDIVGINDDGTYYAKHMTINV